LAAFSICIAQGQNTKWNLVWADNFDGPAGSAPDSSKWMFDLGATGWGNDELQDYKRENVSLDGHGHLVIRAIRTAAGKYTSGRIKTKGLFEVQYGKIEASIKIPRGQGVWPAFWMLGKDVWPQSGEIDVMENVGKEPSIVHGTVHGPGSGPEGSADSIDFFVDGKAYSKVTRAALPTDGEWVFDKPFFLLLNLAIGGDWPGDPTAATRFPQSMLVDGVKVWKRL
jgi:beta-glucanase (GH16 family)